jgi:hypothetical protein
MKRWRRGVAVASLVTTLAVTLWSGAATAGTATPVWRSNMIVNHHFVVPFHLDGATVTVTPDPALRMPAIPGARGASPLATMSDRIWATSQLTSYVAAALGLGDVTIHDRVRGVPAVVNEKAWIGVAFFNTNSIQCPAETAPPRVVVPRWSGWALVVIAMNPRGPSVVYIARREACDHIGPGTLSNARETLSVPWHVKGSGPQVVASLPSCSTIDSIGDGGAVNGPSTLTIYVDRLDDLVTPGCSPARGVAIPENEAGAYTAPMTLHGAVGLVRQVAAP